MMNVEGCTTAALLMMYGGVREAIEIDDMNVLSGLPAIYGVRQFADWKEWSNRLEAELDKRKVKYQRADW